MEAIPEDVSHEEMSMRTQGKRKCRKVSRIIDPRWVISERPGSDGNSDLKARFFARGFSQFIEDPDLIYAATPHMSSLKLLLTIATQR
eukprot:1480092-Amphidinium_carterae.1